MKKLLVVFMTLIMAASLTSCEQTLSKIDIRPEYTVTFVDGERETSGEFRLWDKIVYPTPEERENYSFVGWSYDREENIPVPDNAKVNEDITLYAVWEYNYDSVINTLYSDAIEINVAVKNTSYNTVFGTIVSEAASNGSGVIFDEDDMYYYILTNEHVTRKIDGYAHVKYRIEDCYGNSYSATLLASAPEYDLAIMRFEKGSEQLTVATVSESAPKIGEVVISIGQPGGVRNVITFGEVCRYEEISEGNNEVSEEMNFDVLWHDAPIDHGSSGGALLDGEINLVGINFAVVSDADTEEILFGLSVPLEKLLEFLELYY